MGFPEEVVNETMILHHCDEECSDSGDCILYRGRGGREECEESDQSGAPRVQSELLTAAHVGGRAGLRSRRQSNLQVPPSKMSHCIAWMAASTAGLSCTGLAFRRKIFT